MRDFVLLPRSWVIERSGVHAVRLRGPQRIMNARKQPSKDSTREVLCLSLLRNSSMICKLADVAEIQIVIKILLEPMKALNQFIL